jgi:hypothetical protein
MSRILYRARTARGSDVADFVEAGSAAEAMKLLGDRGLKDIVLLQSPDIAAFNQPLPGLTQKQHARLRAEFMAKPGLATALRGTTRVNGPILLFGAFGLGGGLWWHLLDMAVLGAAALLFPYAAFFWKRRHLDRYQALQKAYARGQWDEVRRIAPMLRKVTNNPLLPWDLDVRLACIEAKQGNLDAALAGLDGWKPKIAVKAPGMFEARLASVNLAAHDYAGYVRLMEQAAELSGQDPSRRVDVALANAKFGDAAKARDIVEHLDMKLLTPLAHKFVAFIKGLLALRAGRPEEAVAALQASTQSFFELALRTQVAWVGVAISSGYYAVALARCGQRAEAQRAIADTLPILLVHGEKPLMDMLQDEVLQKAA